MIKEIVKQVRGVIYGKWILVLCPFCRGVHVHTESKDYLRKPDCRNGQVYNINIVEFNTLPRYAQNKINIRKQTL